MVQPTDIRIPSDLLPADGRFGSGPAKVLPAALDALAATGTGLLGTSHRKPTVRSLVGRLRSGMRDLFAVPDDYEVLLAPGGATAFWDMATFGVIEQQSQHYVFGEFSGKFAKAVAAAPFVGDPVLVESPVGTRPEVRPDAGGVDVQALTHNETSTGTMMEIRRPDGDALVLVDATSGAGGLPVDVSQCDGYYFSLQKGFGSEGGLAVVLASPSLIERIQRIASSGRWIPAFLDLATAVDNSLKDQTYNTPAIATVFLAAETTDWMLKQGGLDAMVARSRAKSDHLYGWAEAREWASPYVADPSHRSLVVGTVDLDGPDADDVNAALRANGVVDTDAYRKLGRNQLRVGMFPLVDPADVQAYTACVDHVVDALS